MPKYVLNVEGDAGSTLTLKGPVRNPGRYFGGADMEDLWFSTKEDAYVFTDKKEAEEAARMYGCGEARKWQLEEL